MTDAPADPVAGDAADAAAGPFPRFPRKGRSYLKVLAEVHRRRKPQRYFEIGVNLGASMACFGCDSVGVDPQMGRVANDFTRGKSRVFLFQMTSDDFFASEDLFRYLPGGYDVAFLDGMHQYEYLLRDFINTERYAHPGSIVFLHDCIPINAEMTERRPHPAARRDPVYRSAWTGDVWKLVPILQRYRPDLTMTVLDSAPTGLVALTGLDPTSRRLGEHYAQIVKAFDAVDLTDEALAGYIESLGVVDPDVFLAGLEPLADRPVP